MRGRRNERSSKHRPSIRIGGHPSSPRYAAPSVPLRLARIFHIRNAAYWARRKTAGIVSIWLLVGSALPASAAVYLNDAVIDDAANIPTLASPPWTGMGRVFHLTQSPNGFVVVEVNRIGSTTSFEFIPQSIAAYYSLCVVNSGEELTYLNVLSKPALGGSNTLTLNPGQEAYIGYWSQQVGKPPNPTPEPDSIIGWAKVTNTAGNLVLLSSASADTGILVGTTQAIPEPSSALLASAASLLFFRRRRNRGWLVADGRSAGSPFSQLLLTSHFPHGTASPLFTSTFDLSRHSRQATPNVGPSMFDVQLPARCMSAETNVNRQPPNLEIQGLPLDMLVIGDVFSNRILEASINVSFKDPN